MALSFLLLPMLGLLLAVLLLLSLVFRLSWSRLTASNTISALPWFPGKCRTWFIYSPEPLFLRTNDGATKILADLVKDVTPPCLLNPLLFNGHLQTFWTAVKYDGPPIHYRRRVFEAEELAFYGHFAVDFVIAAPLKTGAANDASRLDYQGLLEDPTGVGHTKLPPRTTYFTDAEFLNLASRDVKPLLIALHGLSGGSYEVYLRHVLEHLVKATIGGATSGGISGGDWEALVINSRGCAGSVLTSSLLYNARATWDVRQVVKWCKKTWPHRPLFGIGFSIGANMMTNYLGEEGPNCPLSAAVVVSNPWNLDIAAVGLLRTTLGKHVYSKTMGGQMFSLYELHKEQIAKNKKVIRKVAKVASDAGTDPIRPVLLHEFDRTVQCATWGYPTEGAYYRDASCADAIFAVRIPLLAIHSIDDPIAIDEGVPYEGIRQNPYIVMCATSGGGHLGWFEPGGGRWHWKPAVGFLNEMARSVDFNHAERPRLAVRSRSELKPPFAYSPMRRKAYNVKSESSGKFRLLGT